MREQQQAMPGPPSPVSDGPLSLHALLEKADLLCYLDSLKNVLKLRHAGDLYYTDREDLDGLGMSRPEQKRLFREYARHFPSSSTSLAGKESEGRGAGEGAGGGGEGFVGRIRRRMFGGEKQRESRQECASRSGGGNSCGSRETPVQQQQHIIPAERITLCREIGSGEFGCVFQAAWHKDGSDGEAVQVAVKRILPDKLISQPSSFLQEAAIMTRMQHDNVVRLFGVVLDTKAVLLVSELAPCGSLLECLQRPSWRESFSVPSLCDLALQIAKGMHYLASQRLIHRDLAARNVLVSSPKKVKISDFGLSRSLGHGEDYYRSEFSPSMKLPVAWCAPECINFLRFTSASDVWSFGVCLWEMFTYGSIPWAGMTGSQILHAIDTQQRRLARPEACPAEMYSLMADCWRREPEKRPSFEHICERLPGLRPPLLVATADCGDTGGGGSRRSGHLRLERGETVVLLDKSPLSAAAAGLWLGVSESGKVGLFQPELTIAFLGAENPCSAASLDDIPSQMQQQSSGREEAAKEGRRGKKTGGGGKGKKEDQQQQMGDKERKKLLISQPQGDLRHTCHVGADGRTFGLLNIDKNDLPRVLPPKLSPPVSAHPAQDVMLSTSMVSLAPPRPPKGHTFAANGDPMSRSVCLGSSMDLAGLAPDERKCTTPLASFSPAQVVQPPALPPKPPRFQQRTAAGQQESTLTCSSPVSVHERPKEASAILEEKTSSNGRKKGKEENGTAKGPATQPPCSSSFPLSDEEQRRASEERQLETQRSEQPMEEELLMRPVSLCCEWERVDEKKGAQEEEENEKEDEQRIMEILTELQRDLTEFSLCTLDDCSEERPLLDGDRRREEEASRQLEQRQRRNSPHSSPQSSQVVAMDPGELERRVDRERRRAERQLKRDQEETAHQRRSSIASALSTACHSPPKAIRRLLSAGRGVPAGSRDLPKSEKEVVANWSQQADQAYKLMVECGHQLKGQQLSPDAADPEGRQKSRTQSPQMALEIANPFNGKAFPSESSPIGGMSRQKSARLHEQQTGDLEYINSSLLTGGQENNNKNNSSAGERPPQANLRQKQNGPMAPNCEYLNPVMEGQPKASPSKDGAPSRSPPPVPPKPKMRASIQATHCRGN